MAQLVTLGISATYRIMLAAADLNEEELLELALQARNEKSDLEAITDAFVENVEPISDVQPDVSLPPVAMEDWADYLNELCMVLDGQSSPYDFPSPRAVADAFQTLSALFAKSSHGPRVPSLNGTLHTQASLLAQVINQGETARETAQALRQLSKA